MWGDVWPDFINMQSLSQSCCARMELHCCELVYLWILVHVYVRNCRNWHSGQVCTCVYLCGTLQTACALTHAYIITATPTDPLSEMHLQPEPLFSLPTDNIGMLDIQGTPEGRIFLGGKDGCLYEVIYQAEDGWFSRKCKKVNHSVSMLSFLVPSFLSFSEEGMYICQIWVYCM